MPEEQKVLKILFLDDDPKRVGFFRRSEFVSYVRTPREFVDWLTEHSTPDVISFDHDLSLGHYVGTPGYNATSTEETGEDCARYCVENGHIPEIVIVHSWNEAGAKRIADRMIEAGCEDVRIKPFNPKIPHMWKE